MEKKIFAGKCRMIEEYWKLLKIALKGCYLPTCLSKQYNQQQQKICGNHHSKELGNLQDKLAKQFEWFYPKLICFLSFSHNWKIVTFPYTLDSVTVTALINDT